MPLTPKQRSYLKGLAHGLDPLIRIGKSRLTPEVIEETRRTMQAHEVIKVRIDVEEPASRRALGEELAQAVGAELVGHIGKITMIYRPFDEKPVIKLP